MNRSHAALMLGAFIGFAAPCYAQTSLEADPLGPDNDRVIREYVTPEQGDVTEYNQTLSPGSIIPAAVPLKLFPPDAPPNLRKYAYFVSVDHKVVVVEADTRRVVHIIGSH